MNPLVNEFIQKVLTKVKYKKVHPMLAKELYDHIECIKEEYLNEGMDEEKAYEQAIQQMGVPEEIGSDLYRMHKPRTDWMIILLIGTVFAFGMYLLKVTGNEEAIIRMLVYSVVGLVGFFVCYFLNYQKLEKYSLVFVGLGVVILILTWCYGREVNGARRWFLLGPTSVQAISITIPLFLVGFAGLIAGFESKDFVRKVRLVLISLLCIVLTLDNYMVEGVILMVTLYFTAVYYVNRYQKHKKEGKRNKLLLLLIGFGSILTSAFFILTEGYRIQRLHIWMAPDQYPQGYQIMKIRKILSNANWFGDSGLQSVASEGDWQFFSFGIDDYTFLYIVGKLGVFAAVLTMCVLIAFIVRSFLLSHQQRDMYGNLLMTVISTFFALQVTMGIITHLSLIPSATVYVPFLSYNGSSIIFELAALGLFLGIHRRKDILPNELIACEK